MPSEPFSRPATLPMPFTPADRMAAPEAVEADSDTAWDLFNSLSQPTQPATFAPTAPASVPMPLTKGDRRYAQTVPSALTSNTPAVAPVRASKVIAVAEVMVEARRNNRLCPQPLVWQRLYEMLPGKKQTSRGWEPQQPLTGSAWAVTPSLAKRMCLRDHIEWADSHGCLDAVYAFLKELPETDWHHMGD